MFKSELKKGEKILLYSILVVSFFAFILILQDLNSPFLLAFDSKVNLSVQRIQIPSLVAASKIISYVFDPIVFILYFLIIIGILFYKKRKMEGISLVVLTLISAGLLELIKEIVQRPRPLDALLIDTSSSFPSGHALMAVVFFGTLFYLFEHHLKSSKTKVSLTVLATLVVLIISLSRIYLNVHWISDVLGSFMLGIFLLVSFILVVHKIHILNN